MISVKLETEELNEAIRKMDLKRVKAILSTPGVQFIINTAEDPHQYTPLFLACMSENEKFAMEVCQLLLEKGANPLQLEVNSQTVLYYLAKDGKLKLMKFFFQKFKYDINQDDVVQQTPLFFAAASNQIQVAEYLLDNSADINHVDRNGQTCLFYAALNGHLQMCKMLVKRGANYLQMDKNRETPLAYAKKRKFKENRPTVDYFIGLRKSKQFQENNKQQSSKSRQSLELRKRKQAPKNQYFMVFTNEKGQTRLLTLQELDKFGQKSQRNKKILELLENPDRLSKEKIPEQKKFSKIALKLVNYLLKNQQGKIFAEPIDIEALNIPHYRQIVQIPMDYSTVKNKLIFNAYDSEKDFYEDVIRIYDNCIQFNGRISNYGLIACQLKLEFCTLYKKQFGV